MLLFQNCYKAECQLAANMSFPTAGGNVAACIDHVGSLFFDYQVQGEPEKLTLPIKPSHIETIEQAKNTAEAMTAAVIAQTIKDTKERVAALLEQIKQANTESMLRLQELKGSNVILQAELREIVANAAVPISSESQFANEIQRLIADDALTVAALELWMKRALKIRDSEPQASQVTAESTLQDSHDLSKLSVISFLEKQWNGLWMHCCLKCLNFDGTGLSEPRMTVLRRNLATLCRNGTVFKQCTLRNLNLDEMDLSKGVFLDCSFESVTLWGTNLTSTILSNCIMTDCSLSNLKLYRVKGICSFSGKDNFLSPSGEYLAVMRNMRAAIWHFGTMTLDDIEEGFKPVYFSPCSRYIIGKRPRKQLIVWDILQKRPDERFKQSTAVESIALSWDNSLFAAVTTTKVENETDCILTLWETATVQKVSSIYLNNRKSFTALFSPCNQWIAVADHIEQIALYSVPELECQIVCSDEKDSSVLTFQFTFQFAFSPSGDRLYYVFYKGEVSIKQIGEEEDSVKLLGKTANQVSAMAVSLCGAYVAAAHGKTGVVTLFNVAQAKPSITYPDLYGTVTSLAFSSDARLIHAATYTECFSWVNPFVVDSGTGLKTQYQGTQLDQ